MGRLNLSAIASKIGITQVIREDEDHVRGSTESWTTKNNKKQRDEKLDHDCARIALNIMWGSEGREVLITINRDSLSIINTGDHFGFCDERKPVCDGD
jgi:hypothetical protein